MSYTEEMIAEIDRELKPIIAERDSLIDENARLYAALLEIKEFTRGYGDIALVVHRMADKALRRTTSDANEH